MRLYAPNFYPQNSVYGGVNVKVTDWFSLHVGVNVVRENNGEVRLLPSIVPIINWVKVLGIKKKKKPVVPQWWY
ncbi:MAG: hypothetical protein FWF72_00145 [Paludibacter sp.]|nr:hypothetical protein [Paludibacter sp.]